MSLMGEAYRKLNEDTENKKKSERVERHGLDLTVHRVTLEVDYVFYPSTTNEDVEEMFSEQNINGSHAYRDSAKFRSKFVKAERLGNIMDVLKSEKEQENES